MSRNRLIYALLLAAIAAFAVKADDDTENFDVGGDYEYPETVLDEDEDTDEILRRIKNTELTKTATRGLLYPTETETREVRLLNGIWNFVKSDKNKPQLGVQERWYENDLKKSRPVIPMAVPASYNDISTGRELRDHVGTVWYERKIFIPIEWKSNRRIWLRFGSVHYSATVWLNGKNVTQHDIGHLPFEVEITNYTKYGKENRITVLCDNTLSGTTVPQGKVHKGKNSNGNYEVFSMSYAFDFFNYAGIHRSVHLYTTPMTFIEDIAITTDLTKDKTGYVNYKVTVNTQMSKIKPSYVDLNLLDKDDEPVIKVSNRTFEGKLKVKRAKPWWPYLMHPEPAYLYTLEIYLRAADQTLLDVYRLKIGIRTLKWTNTSVLLNGKELYLRGFGRHEDSDIHGRGLDLALLTRDYNLLKWIGANAYRTSHYPYSEEEMQLADDQGIMIIDECPAVAAVGFSSELLLNHKSSLDQLIHRDRNHPSVIMWSIANEPRTGSKKSYIYFKKIADYVRNLDPTRPITSSTDVFKYKDNYPAHLDVISFNKYVGWYQNEGRLKKINNTIINIATTFNKKFKKPIIVSEYGADTAEGLHFLPEYIWSEEYQSNLLAEHFKAFDFLRKKKWFIGEFVWNFADFKTSQKFRRVGGNRKGVFTRNRQPKAAAHLLRQRYHSLGHLLDDSKLPEDLSLYVVDENGKPLTQHDLAEL